MYRNYVIELWYSLYCNITYSPSPTLGNQSIGTDRNFSLDRGKEMFNFQLSNFIGETKEGPDNKDRSGKILSHSSSTNT